MKKTVIPLLCTLLAAAPLAAQEYHTPEVRLSQDKVKVEGKTYYAHVVGEKQTLYSISKAYNVSLDDIYAANPDLHLKQEGLKAGQILLIPTNPGGGSTSSRWLFPGLGRKSTEAEVPAQPSAPDTLRSHAVNPPADSTEYGPRDTGDFILDIPARIEVAVVLPFSDARLSDNAVDFYSGVLLAARELGNSGTALDIKALDIRDSLAITPRSLENYDVIFGPITGKDMKSMLRRCPSDKFIISPLDPQATALAKGFPSIQAPTPVNAQNADVVRWALEDLAPADSLVLITARGNSMSATAKNLADCLKASGHKYHTISYDILDGASVQRSFIAHASLNGTTRYIIASDEESFVSDAIRNINLMTFKKYDVALYAPSRLRSFSHIASENLHSINTHVCATYHTDYDNKAVNNFILAYRALFNAEPNSFAFHGYDTMNYFAGICRTYGRQWPKKLDTFKGHGIQTDFAFSREEEAGGFVNHAVRRIIYTPDYQIILQ